MSESYQAPAGEPSRPLPPYRPVGPQATAARQAMFSPIPSQSAARRVARAAAAVRGPRHRAGCAVRLPRYTPQPSGPAGPPSTPARPRPSDPALAASPSTAPRVFMPAQAPAAVLPATCRPRRRTRRRARRRADRSAPQHRP